MVSLKLILEVTSELTSRHTEEVLNQVSSQANSLVGVVVLVVGVTSFNGHFEDLTDNTAEVDGFLFPVFDLVAQVREKFSIKKLVDTSLSVLLLLACCEFLFQPLVAFIGGDNLVFFVVVHLVDVGDDVLERIRVSSNGLEDVLVVFDTKGSHQQNDRNGRRTGGADLDHQHTVSALFDGQWLAHTVFLGENLGYFCLLGVALVDFNGDAVRGEVFHGDENALGSVDDEIATGIEGVFALLAEEFVPGGFVLCGRGWGEDAVASDVLGVEVASLRANHNRHVADGNTGFGGRGYAVSLDGEVDGDWRHVGQFTESAFHW